MATLLHNSLQRMLQPQRQNRCNAISSRGNEDEVDDVLAQNLPQGRRPGREVEVEIITRDGVIKRRVKRPEDSFTIEIKKTGMQFAGLDFGNSNKSSETPAGLYAAAEPRPGKLPDVEIITAKPTNEVQTGDDVYKPRISTWGVFPRPSDISRTYGGGRTIQPGQPLETPEESQARDAKTRELLSKYRQMMGLDVDPKTQLECQQLLSKGNGCMDNGKLKQAIDFYEEVLQRMAFQNELHGQALMQKAICLETWNRSSEARAIYEKLLSHPNYSLKKRAKQLVYTFQAAESLKLSKTTTLGVQERSQYRSFFDVLPNSYGAYNTSYKAQEGENEKNGLAFVETMVFAGLLILPLMLVLGIVLRHK